MKNQATIPVDALRKAGLKAGDELRVESAGAGRVVLARIEDPIARWKGHFKGLYPPGHLDKLRDEWR